jgi:hypothetical protein
MCRYICISFLLAVVSCQNHQYESPNKIAETGVNSLIAVKTTENSGAPSTRKLLEFFSDDSNIGTFRKNKIEISHFKILDGDMVEIKFYSRAENKDWHFKQTFEYEKFGSLPIEPNLEDFDNDGFKDMTFVSGIAARGANDIRKLFIYDEKKDELIYIKNSEEYPNIKYNRKLNCIDAMLFYGGTSTVFLKIDVDSLKEFASVESFGSKRTVSVIDRNGRKKVLRTDKIEEDEVYERYENFNPPEPYRDYQ